MRKRRLNRKEGKVERKIERRGRHRDKVDEREG